jgi:hypothetical protein
MPDVYSLSVIDQRLQQTVDANDAGPSKGFLRLVDGAGNVVSSFQTGAAERDRRLLGAKQKSGAQSEPFRS